MYAFSEHYVLPLSRGECGPWQGLALEQYARRLLAKSSQLPSTSWASVWKRRRGNALRGERVFLG